MKIPIEYEDIIDTNFYKLSDELSPYFKQINFTPNMITTLALFSTLASIYNIANGNCMNAALFYAISYFFDCMDGHFARKYKMTSPFGDYYEHIVDWIRNMAVIGMILYSCNCNNSYVPIIIIIVFFILGNIKQAYQDKYYKIKTGRNESESLDFLQKVVSPPNDINVLKKRLKLLKHTGWGSFTLCVSFFLISCTPLSIKLPFQLPFQ